MDSVIRKAEMRDRDSIHAAHMRSIREICVKDHGLEEIKGWGYRELGERWIDEINKGLVWVVDEARKRKVQLISLDSTITAHEFYKRFGFQDSGPARKRPIGGAPVTSFPMQLNLTHSL